MTPAIEANLQNAFAWAARSAACCARVGESVCAATATLFEEAALRREARVAVLDPDAVEMLEAFEDEDP